MIDRDAEQALAVEAALAGWKMCMFCKRYMPEWQMVPRALSYNPSWVCVAPSIINECRNLWRERRNLAATFGMSTLTFGMSARGEEQEHET